MGFPFHMHKSKEKPNLHPCIFNEELICYVNGQEEEFWVESRLIDFR
jgi:hypothetical protein